jgi:hypothetical protein
MKIFRDPIHNVIDLDTGDKAVNDLLIKLIDSKEFQRLRYIKQLGFSYCAYPSAVHTRFEHSLGVAFLAKRLLEKIISLKEITLVKNETNNFRKQLVNFFEQIEQQKPLAIVAALLHDIGHGPLSHVIEGITGINHEEWVREIIMGNTEVHALLAGFNKTWPQDVCDILSDNKRYYSAKILTGHIDIDKMDYLLRDSHMTGTGYGKFDIEWLINVLTVGVTGAGSVEIGLELNKGLSVAESLVMARIYMFKNVYLHKVTLVAQRMLKKLLERVKTVKSDIQLASFPNDDLKTIILQKGHKPSELLENYLSITDVDFNYFLKSLQTSRDVVLRDLSVGLFNRCLFKELSQKDWNTLKLFIEDRNNNDGTAEYYTEHIQIDARAEKMVYTAGESEMILFDKNGVGFPLSQKSSVVRAHMQADIIPLGYYAASQIYANSNYQVGVGKDGSTITLANNKNDIKYNIDNARVEELMVKSIEEASKSIPEDGKINPKVGAVLCDSNGEILLTAYRGEKGNGTHCEYSLLEKIEEKNISCANTVLFVTLEPCTKRNEPKKPCAKRIVEAKIPIVYIGAIDPNPDFRSYGETYLRDHSIIVERYPNKYVEIIRTMNKEFEQQFYVKRSM